MAKPGLLVNVYLDKCKEFGTPVDQDGADAYYKIDQVILWIENQPNKTFYKLALTTPQICIKIPIEKAQNFKTLEGLLPRGYNDEIVDGIPVYYCEGLFDMFRAEIIHKLCDKTDSVLYLRWKLRRPEKYMTLGIVAFRKQYKF